MLFYFFREYTKIPSFPRSRESERVRTKTYIPSFPRKWESSFLSFSHFREIALALNVWIPACAGMTGFEIAAFIGSNRSRSAVIPTKVGIQCVEFQLFRINFETLI
ncbi:TPA: hypothetical protein ACJJEK_001771, partial [Neisseria meningitidis]